MIRACFGKVLKKMALKVMTFSLITAVAFGMPGNVMDVSAMDADGDIVIVIDPGHGGNDPGKVGVNGVKEEDVNYEIAVQMRAELAKYDGVKVYLTRPEDSWFTNTGRAMVAAALDADFIISLHNNSGTETSAGAIVYTSVLPLYSSITADMGNYILENLQILGIKNNGIQTRNSTEYEGEDYYTLMAEAMRAGTPAVLIEHCFLSNPVDSLHVSHEDGSMDYEKIKKIGQADADAVIRYFNLEKNVAVADSNTTVSLEKGYSVEVTPKTAGIGDLSWVSSNESVVVVDEYGVATAVNSGSCEVMYSYSDGTTGSLKIEVAIPEQVALVGAIDPTFYDTAEEFAAIDMNSVIANVIYSDGSAKSVTIDSFGAVDYSIVGVQDIPITYGMLSGYVRVLYTPQEYVPEVTSKETEAPTEPETTTEAVTEDVTETQSASTEDDEEGGMVFDIYTIVKFAAAIIIVSVIGTAIYLIENKISSKKRKNRRRRRY